MSRYRLSKRSMGQLVGVLPELAFAAAEAIKITRVDFAVHDGLRSLAQQKRYVETGVSTTLDSYHLYGLAIDLVPYVNGKLRWEVGPCVLVNDAVREVTAAHGIEVQNGFDLWGWDYPHWQKTGHKRLYDVRHLPNDIAN